jgi:Arc/MetJ-type ribon-helix-helix transcriptional regulator
MDNTIMRNTKVYSITMPPDLAKQAERLAKKENRTMSELMREALRRYQQPQVFFDPTQFIRREAPVPLELKAIREDAKQKGTDKLTMAQINREVAAVRRQEKKQTNRTAK